MNIVGTKKRPCNGLEIVKHYLLAYSYFVIH